MQQKKKEAEDIENRVEEERKVELAGSRTKIVARRIRTKGRMGDEEEGMGREEEIGRRTKGWHNDRGNNAHIRGRRVATTNNKGGE